MVLRLLLSMLAVSFIMSGCLDSERLKDIGAGQKIRTPEKAKK
jgi:hypothetical protein